MVSQPPSTQVVNLAAGQTFDIAPFVTPVGGGAPAFDLSVQNLSSATNIILGLEEMGYGFRVVLGSAQPDPASWSVLLVRDGDFLADNVTVAILGKDTFGGSTVDLWVHTPGTPTDVPPAEGLPSLAPGFVELLGNHPNPFNPSTTIAYKLAAASAVELQVYDLAGRRVRTLESGVSRSAGRHTVTWNGTDDTGRSVASGAYVYRVSRGAGAIL